MTLTNSLKMVQSKDCLIEVFGLGYIGLPLALRFASSGFKVSGVDPDSKKIQNLKNNSLDHSHSSLKSLLSKSLEKGNFIPSVQSIKSQSTKIGIICVPTPVSDEDSNVFVLKALENFLDTAKSGDIIILESSIKIGTTKAIEQIINSKGFNVGEDFGLCFCPERIDPLNQKWKLENIPRIIYTSDDVTFQIAQNLYQHVNHSMLHRVYKAEIAEVVKSFENAFRLVNISLVNELAILCEKLKINVKDVLDAAATKPFGFMPFSPGAGAGGHCIPKDPTFLSDSDKKINFNLSSIENALTINLFMPN